MWKHLPKFMSFDSTTRLVYIKGITFTRVSIVTQYVSLIAWADVGAVCVGTNMITSVSASRTFIYIYTNNYYINLNITNNDRNSTCTRVSIILQFVSFITGASVGASTSIVADMLTLMATSLTWIQNYQNKILHAISI